MQIMAGYDILYECRHPTPMILMLSPHPSRDTDLAEPQVIAFDPPVAAETYLDGFGNRCTRFEAPAGALRISSRMQVADSGAPDVLVPGAEQHPVSELPHDTLVYLLGSRYCDTDRMSNRAWELFGNGPRGWALVQACRDYAHLAVTLCRCLNIPARYCTGFLGDMGTEPPYGVMDFAAWFEVYLGGAWHTFDARNNTPRIGRILIARGRDATDVAIATTFGPCFLAGFSVVCEEIGAAPAPVEGASTQIPAA